MKKNVKKISKCQDLNIEIQRLWHKQAMAIPVVIDTLGAVPKMLELHLKYLNIDKVTAISQIQKATLLGSVYIIHKNIMIS